MPSTPTHLASEERVDRFRRGIYNGCSARAAHREERSSPQLFVRSLRLSISPPQTDADAGGSRPNQRDPDADELGLDSRDAVRDADIWSGVFVFGPVGEDEVVRPGTREIDRERPGGAVRGKQASAQADERIPLVLPLAEDIQVHDVAREIGELPGHTDAPEHLDLVHIEPRGSRRNRRDRPLRPLQERRREEPLSGEEQDTADEKEDPWRLPQIGDQSESPTPLHRPTPDTVIGGRLYGDSHTSPTTVVSNPKIVLTSENIACVEDCPRTFMARWELRIGHRPIPPGFLRRGEGTWGPWNRIPTDTPARGGF